jgi:outer membrane protein
MLFARLSSTVRLAVAASLFGTLVLAQEPPATPTPQNTSEAKPVPALNYAKPVSHFPNPIGPYTARHLAPPNLANTARIDSLMHDGKLYLSLNDAIALALENNLDIAIARYNLNIADTDVLRAKAGATTLGVNTGIVQNTPGGGVGGLGGQVGSGTGGTTLGAGGAGAGAGGLVGSTLGFGPLITSFDPILTGIWQSDHANFIPTSPFSGTLQRTTTADFAYTQGFQWGTNLSVGFNNTRTTTNNAFSTVSPALNSNFQFKLTQHLLQGLGFAANSRFIRIAKNNRELSDVAFRLQAITTVDQIENMYWDLRKNSFRHEETGRNRQPRADRNRARAEPGSQGPAVVDRRQNQSSARTVADEECTEPNLARSGSCRSGSHSNFDDGSSTK